jgi:hypothetical protein
MLPAGALGLLLPRLAPDAVLLTALCQGLFFGDDDTIVDTLRLGEAAETRLDALPLDRRLQLRGDLRSLELGVALLIGVRLSSASRAEVRLALQHLRSTARGPALARLQELCALACYGHPNLLAELGYAGPQP